MVKRFIGMSVIWFFTALAWMILSGSVDFRTHQTNRLLYQKVGDLWGSPQTMHPPVIKWSKEIVKREQTIRKDEASGKEITTTKLVPKRTCGTVQLDATEIDASIDLQHRKKGLLWYATYLSDIKADYTFSNRESEPLYHVMDFTLPDQGGTYDNFICMLNGEETDYSVSSGKIQVATWLNPQESAVVTISFRSFGQDEWRYLFTDDTSAGQVKDFRLSILTNFHDIDFPDGTLSPTIKEETGERWKLTWSYDHLMAGTGVGLKLPKKINPGPFVARVTRFAPVSLLFFFFVLFVITTLRRVDIRMEHYFFLACAFFAFHLLFAYLVDHIDLHLSFLISSTVSILLVISYLRLVTGIKFALREAGISQFIYLILFSYSFFFEGYTGLIITIGAITTLFIVMQTTGRKSLCKESNGR